MICDGEELGSQWPIVRYRDVNDRAADARTAVFAAEARMCRNTCGNYKTHGMEDGLCNSCRGGPSTSQPASKKRSRVEEEDTSPKLCPRCGKNLAEMGPLRTERHARNCGGGD